MKCRRHSAISCLAIGVAVAVVGGGAVTGAEAPAAVARPHIEIGEMTETSGLVFFLRTARLGVVAVGTAHAFDLGLVTRVERVTFLHPIRDEPIAASVGWLVPPGIPFNAPGGSLDQDFLVYALGQPNVSARILAPEVTRQPVVGERVRVIGPGPGGETVLLGLVAKSTRARIEVELSGSASLEGWGGAPIVSERTDRVVGFTQAARLQAGTTTLVGTPIASVLRATESPYNEALGRRFSTFAELAALRSPSSAAASGIGVEPLIRQAPEIPGVRLRIEYPPNGAVVEDSTCGAFVAGVASSQEGELRRFDVIFVLDVSGSTQQSTGVDINENGVIGRPLDSPSALFTAEDSDPGDSILAAEVAAARELLGQLDRRSTRVGLVTFSSVPDSRGLLRNIIGSSRHAHTLKPLTSSFAQIESALDELLDTRPVGETHIAAGLDQATIELLGLRGALSQSDAKSEKVVFFFTDGQPTLPYGPEQMARNVAETFAAADRARRGDITVHSFAIGPDALAGPIATVEMGARTGGNFTPVRHPGELVDVVEAVDWPSLRDIEIGSVTRGERPVYFQADDDGGFSALVRMNPGLNDVEIRARADDGTQTTVVLEMRVREGARSVPIPKRLAARRNELLESCLADVRNRRLETETGRNEAVRRDLLIEIERERAKARKRAAEQRRELKLEIER